MCVLCSVIREVWVWLEELDFIDREKEKMEKKDREENEVIGLILKPQS